MFDNQLSGELLANAPKNLTDKNGCNYWSYQHGPAADWPQCSGGPTLRRVRHGAEFFQPAALGCYDVHARIDDMDVNGIAASMCFGHSIGFDGQTFHKAPDKKLALRHMQAWNDWHYEERCIAYSGRFIPLCILPTWDVAATVAEINRCAKKGFRTVSMNENPTVQGLPSIHNDYWDPIYKAITAFSMILTA